MVRRILLALPNGIEDGLFQLAKVALSSIVAMFGTVQIAAYGISQNFWGMGALFPMAMGPAFITIIGQYMGARDIDGADYYGAFAARMIFFISGVHKTTFLLSVRFFHR